MGLNMAPWDWNKLFIDLWAQSRTRGTSVPWSADLYFCQERNTQLKVALDLFRTYHSKHIITRVYAESLLVSLQQEHNHNGASQNCLYVLKTEQFEEWVDVGYWRAQLLPCRG